MGSKIEARSLVEAVTERLEASIISGDLEPGTRLREQVLAKEYGISRGPLREAIRRLEGRRLLERKANIGVSVVALSLRRLDELLKVREALEGMACRLAAERIEQDEVDQIRKLLDEHALRDEVLSGGGPEPMATFYRNSWDERIAGDLAIQVEEDCLLGGSRLATSHGSPYAYDRAVPLVFFGPGIEPGRVDGPAWTVDIAPTLAALLGVRVPDDLAGRPLPMR